jgi:hypothetical protein
MRELGNAKIIQENLKVPVTTFRFDARSISQVLTNIRVNLLDKLATHHHEIMSVPMRQPQPQAEVFKLSPEFYGVGIDLKVLWRKLFGPKGKDRERP